MKTISKTQRCLFALLVFVAFYWLVAALIMSLSSCQPDEPTCDVWQQRGQHLCDKYQSWSIKVYSVPQGSTQWKVYSDSVLHYWKLIPQQQTAAAADGCAFPDCR